MNKKPFPEFESLIMVEGSVYAHVGFDVSKANFELGVGEKRVPFMECTDEALQRYSFSNLTYLDCNGIANDMVSQPVESQPGEIFACWTNRLADWTLSGSHTVQLMISRYDQPCHIDIRRPLSVQQKNEAMAFYASLAVHRAEAELHVVLTDAETGQKESHSIRFDRSNIGGTRRSGYQKVKIALPQAFRHCDIHLSVDYLRHVPDNKGTEPFLFLAEMHVGPAAVDRNQSVAVPELLIDEPITADGQWMVAYLPAAPANGDAISLVTNGALRKIADVTFPKMFIRENYGHTLILEAETVEELLLCVDGKPVSRLNVNQGDTVLRFPPAYLDGAVHYLSIRDRSGSISYIETLHLAPAILTPTDVIQRETAAPYPDTVFPQTARRYAALKAQMAHATAETDLAQLSYALSVLEGGYDKVKLKPLRFPQVEAPTVSIIIPAHNKVEVTYLALCSLLVAYNETSFEVIVIDDGSTDETTELDKIVSGITVIHNEEAQRFIRACNAGAEAARGDYIVLLNNDVEVTSGWLDELVASFGRFDKVGLAGAKLLYPDGKLQDAGGIIWGNGNPWNYGNRQNPNDPRFSYARQADYLSGAAMMVPAALWKEVGGLSSYLEPMYFEDTDFAFKIREAGYSTWFVPSSVIYHYEGMTSGTDVSKGFKRFQEVNRPKFKRRWSQAYAGFGLEGRRPDLEKDRGIVGRVLFIDYTTPRPDQDAGSYAALQEIRLVQSLGYKVSFLPTNMAHLGSHTEDLQKLGVEMIYAPFFLSPAEYLSKHAADFDAFYITRYYVAQDVLGQIRAALPDAKVVFNNADLHFLREMRTAQSENDPELLEKARQTRRDELEIINRADVVLSYNEIEHSVIQAYTEGRANVVKCPWVVEIPEEVPALSGRKGLSFLGSYRHYPNAIGIKWFAQEVMPLLKGVPLSIYGSGMTEEIRALKSDWVDPVGFVQDIADAYDRHRIFIAPLLSGAGIKGKVLSALAHGIPCVLTPIAAEGIGLRHGHDCFIAEKPEEWIEAIDRLMQEDELWTAMSTNARAYMRAGFSFEQGRKQMRKAFEAMDLFQSLA